MSAFGVIVPIVILYFLLDLTSIIQSSYTTNYKNALKDSVLNLEKNLSPELKLCLRKEKDKCNFDKIGHLNTVQQIRYLYHYQKRIFEILKT
jgi:hypothetical protein